MTYKALLRRTMVATLALCSSIGLNSTALHAQSLGGVDDPVQAEYRETMAKKTVMFLPMGLNFDLAVAWVGGVKRDLATLGIDLQVRDPNWDANVGAQALTEMISDKPDLIVVHSPDMQSYAKLIRQAEREGIFVVQVNMRSAYSSDAYVGANWIEMGELLASAAVEACKGKSGKIAIMQGAPAAATSMQTLKGLDNVLSKHPEITVVSNQAANWEAARARSIAQIVLKQHPDLCAYVGASDVQDAGIAEAVREAGLSDQVFVATSGGGETKACRMVADGSFDLNVVYDARTQASDMSAIIRWLLSSSAKPGDNKASIYTTLTPLTKELAAVPGACWSLDQFKL